MTRIEFLTLCETHEVAPPIALENERVTAALKAKDDEEVKLAFKEEF